MSDTPDLWSEEELENVIKALQGVTFPVGHSHKKFARDMAAKAIPDLTERQIEHIARVAWRYRRQLRPAIVVLLGRPWVSLVLADAKKPEKVEKPKTVRPTTPICQYCGREAKFKTDPRSRIRKSFGPIWFCEPCDAWTGCYKDTCIPLGELADHHLRRYRSQAWQSFSWLWQSGKMSKAEACSWLAGKLAIRPEDCQLGKLTTPQLIRAIEVCQENQTVRR